MKHTPMKRMLALLLALLLALSTIALAEEAVEAPAEAGEVIQEAEPTNPEEPAGEVPAADDAADNADDDAADDAADTADDNAAADDAAGDADADDGEIVAAVAAEDVSVSAEAVDAVIEEEEEELIDEEAVEEEVELVDEEEVYVRAPKPQLIVEFWDIASERGFEVTSPDFYNSTNNVFEVPLNTLQAMECTGSVTFNPEDNSLTLTGFSGRGGLFCWPYKDDAVLSEAALDGMNMSADSTSTIPTLTLNLDNDNQIIAIANTNSCAMRVEGPLCIKGNGTLNLKTSLTEGAFGSTWGILCEDLTIEDAPTINVTAGEAKRSIGIAVMNNISITGGTLTAQSEGVIEGQFIEIPIVAEAGEALMEVGSSKGLAAGAATDKGKLSLGDKMQLKYGKDASSATVETAEKFNKLFETYDIENIPLYVRVEPKPTNPETPAGRPDPSFPIDTLFFATVVSDSEDAHALKLAWTPANNVDGYDVFLKRCNAKKKEPFKLVGTSTGLECTIKDLKKSKCYKGYVQPYVMEGNVKKYVLEPSKRFHVYTNNGRKGLSNPANVKVKYSKAEKKAGLDTVKKKTVPLGKTIKIKADVTGAKTGKVIEHVAKLRLYPSNPNVVKVVRKKGKNGKKGYVGLKGVGEGTCKVYVLTNNGICDYFTITVTPAVVANAGKKKGKK